MKTEELRRQLNELDDLPLPSFEGKKAIARMITDYSVLATKAITELEARDKENESVTALRKKLIGCEKVKNAFAASIEALRKENEQYKHKAEQYDTVVKLVNPADGGQYRHDVVSAIEALQRQNEQLTKRTETAEQRIEELEAVAMAASIHTENAAIQLSHLKDLADAAMELPAEGQEG